MWSGPVGKFKMLLLGVGTPWQLTRRNSFLCPGWSVDWFAGKSSTRIATFWMRLRYSSGSESKASSATLTNSSRSILHPQTRGRSLRVAVVCVFILVTFFAVAFVFLFFLFGL